MPKLEKVGGVPGNVLGMLSDLTHKLQHGSITPHQLALFTGGKNPFVAGKRSVKTSVIGITNSQAQAAEIMGDNFISPHNIVEHFGVSWLPSEIKKLEQVPFDPHTLATYHETHILLPGHPMTMSDIMELNPSSALNGWNIRDAPLSLPRVGLRWYLIGKFPVIYSYGQNFADQCKHLPEDQEVPLSCEFTYATIAYYLKTGIKNNPDIALRCKDGRATESNIRAAIGKFGEKGMHICDVSDEIGHSWVGLASSVKLPNT